MAVKPVAPTEQQLRMNIDPNNYQTKIPSLSDVQKEFGLQDAQKYADQISGANAQSKLDGIEAQRRQIDQGLREGQSALDVDFFHQFRNQKEMMAQRGLNAGIAAQKDTQLDMNRQAQLGNLLRDANRSKDNLAQDTRRVEIERQAEALQIRSQELQRQIDLAFKKGDFLQAENARRMQLDVEKEKMRIDGVQFNYSKGLETYFGDLENESRVRMEGLEKQKIGIDAKRAENEARMAQLNYQLRQQEINNDKWYKQQSLSSAAADRAWQQAQSASKQAQALAEQNTLKQRQVDALVTGVKSKKITPQKAMEQLYTAYNKGMFTDRNGDYKAAVQAVGDAGYQYVYKDKDKKKKK
jgi:hypothetical protein